MKKVAYLITRSGTQELIGGCLLNTTSTGRQGVQVVALHFCEDGVFHLVKGSKNAAKVARAMAEQGVKVIACECSVGNRGLEEMLIEGVEIGHLADFFAAAEEADHVIAL